MTNFDINKTEKAKFVVRATKEQMEQIKEYCKEIGARVMWIENDLGLGGFDND